MILGIAVASLLFQNVVRGELPEHCPKVSTKAKPIKEPCAMAFDPNKLPKTKLEKWFTKTMFNDLFPSANIGLGPHLCLPYSYEAFIIAARYFPEFGSESPNKVYKPHENQRRDVAAFFAHVLQETGENNLGLYNMSLLDEEASECFYRGGFYNWFERGPTSDFLHPKFPGHQLPDGKRCVWDGRYCKKGEPVGDFWYPCNDETEFHANVTYYKGCYFGRGPLQLSWNYNYGQFQQFLLSKKIKVDLLNNPNLVMVKMDPPLAMMASLWFYMTPQPPKPSMHDIVVGQSNQQLRLKFPGTWKPSSKNRRAGFHGPSFGPTSLIINNECGGEDQEEPGGPGESRRIKAFKWFCNYFNVTAGQARSLSCKGMLEGFEQQQHMYSWQPDWGNMWRSSVCDCKPAPYGGPLPYYDPKFYPERFARENDRNRLRCVYSIYESPETFRLDTGNSPCLKHKPKLKLSKDGY